MKAEIDLPGLSPGLNKARRSRAQNRVNAAMEELKRYEAEHPED